MSQEHLPVTPIRSTLIEVMRLLQQIGHPLEGSPFAQSLAKLQNATYKIAFVGRFQVGKSTLINRAFIKDAALLTSGEGLPTTAVATELKFGNTPRLEVFNWNLTGDSIPKADQLEISAKVVENPSADDMARETANDDPASRTELARKLARVVLEWPSESLKRYTLLDTPGIDDPDEVLLANTTYRLLPECDLAVLVVPAAQLSKIETDFLRQKLFDQGFTRLLVLVSHHADTQPRSAAMLARILANIRGQLDGIGRANVPVQMYCYDETAEGDFLKTPEQIETAVLRFANEQAEPARIEKVAHLARQALHQAGNKLQAEIAAHGKTEEERKAMLANVRKDIAAMNRRYDQVADDLCLSVRGARDVYIAGIIAGLHAVNAEFVSGFSSNDLLASDSYDAARRHIGSARNFLDLRVQRVIVECTENFERNLKIIAQKFSIDLKIALQELGLGKIDLGKRTFVNRLLLNMDGMVLTAGQALLFNVMPIPGVGKVVGWVVGNFLERGLERFRFTPQEYAYRQLVQSATLEISDALNAIQSKVIKRISSDSESAELQFKQYLSEIIETEIEPWELALQQPAENYDVQQALTLLSEIDVHIQRLSDQPSALTAQRQLTAN
jgi:hypothetical protein